MIIFKSSISTLIRWQNNCSTATGQTLLFFSCSSCRDQNIFLYSSSVQLLCHCGIDNNVPLWTTSIKYFVQPTFCYRDWRRFWQHVTYLIYLDTSVCRLEWKLFWFSCHTNIICNITVLKKPVSLSAMCTDLKLLKLFCRPTVKASYNLSANVYTIDSVHTLKLQNMDGKKKKRTTKINTRKKNQHSQSAISRGLCLRGQGWRFLHHEIVQQCCNAMQYKNNATLVFYAWDLQKTKPSSGNLSHNHKITRLSFVS